MTFADTIDPWEISTGIPNQPQLKVERCCEEFCAASSKCLEPNFETRSASLQDSNAAVVSQSI